MSDTIDKFGAIGRVESRANRLLPLAIVEGMNMLKSFVWCEIRITKLMILSECPGGKKRFSH